MLFFFFQFIGHIINIENLLYEVVNTYFMQFHTRNLSILSIYVFFFSISRDAVTSTRLNICIPNFLSILWKRHFICECYVGMLSNIFCVISSFIIAELRCSLTSTNKNKTRRTLLQGVVKIVGIPFKDIPKNLWRFPLYECTSFSFYNPNSIFKTQGAKIMHLSLSPYF